MASGSSQTELRLVLLGRTGAGKSSAGNAILGRQAFQLATDGVDSQGCHKYKGEVAGRQVAVITAPDWFSSQCPLEDVQRHISSFMALSTPGPHAFLLCIPVKQPVDGEDRALEALERLLGPSVTSKHSLVLFTRVEELEEVEQLRDLLSTGCRDLLELVDRCGDRYHALRTPDGEEEQSEAVEQLLEKVEEAVAGSRHLSCPLYEEAEARVRERQLELVRAGREESGGGGAPPAGSPTGDEDVSESEMERVREEAERSARDLAIDVDGIFPPSPVVSLSAPPSSFLWGLWETLMGWLRWLPRLLRREALLGSLVSLFVGGPFGGMMGATVGSVATEVGRRKTQKNK